jgi:hypothetical protein
MPSINLFPLTLPPAQPPRDIYFCIRLSQTERTAISALAERLHLPASTLSRHILLQAIDHLNGVEESAIEA